MNKLEKVIMYCNHDNSFTIVIQNSQKVEFHVKVFSEFLHNIKYGAKYAREYGKRLADFLNLPFVEKG